MTSKNPHAVLEDRDPKIPGMAKVLNQPLLFQCKISMPGLLTLLLRKFFLGVLRWFFFFWCDASKRSSATVTAHSYTVNFSAPEKKKRTSHRRLCCSWLADAFPVKEDQLSIQHLCVTPIELKKHESPLNSEIKCFGTTHQPVHSAQILCSRRYRSFG